MRIFNPDVICFGITNLEEGIIYLKQTEESFNLKQCYFQ
jgi:hypothetical protein